KIDAYCVEKEINLIIRKHPRDDVDYGLVGLGSRFSIDTRLPEQFLIDVNDSFIIVSPLSTMAFELIHLGARVVFYTTDFLDEVYQESYKGLSIRPYRILEKDEFFLCPDIYASSLFS